MSASAWAPLRAQVGAEIRMRLRSIALPIALVALCAATFFWIPDPGGHAASLTWEIGGRIQAPAYSAAYVGLSVAILSCMLLPLGGFYLVAGSVRRDRERGIGAILAATPLSKAAYLGGKFAAHAAYLLVLDVLALLTGLVAFLRYGAGTFMLSAFAGPYFVLTVPVIAVVASLAVVFDVTPGLRGRGGLVIWFFFFLFALVRLPLSLAGAEDDPSEAKTISRPVFDPAGIATDQWVVRDTIPKEATRVSAGHVVYGQRTIEHVPWKGIRVTRELVAMRSANALLAAIPLAIAILVFDRFDPARRRRRARKPGRLARLGARIARRRRETAAPDLSASAVTLTPVSPRPSTRFAVLAEARLIWESASWIKWPLAVSAMLAGLLPGNLAQGAFLLLLVPVVSEAAAREKLAGAGALVFSQPGVPRSPALWKFGAVALVVLALGAPLFVRSLLVSPVRGLACAGGLLALAAISVGMGSLSGGGKLFTGIYLAVWYLGLSNLAAADFTSALSANPEPVYCLIYICVGAGHLAAAVGRERLRTVS